MQYLLGIDLGSSSIKGSLLDVATGTCIATSQFPKVEMLIDAPFPGWAEQNPENWWQETKNVIGHLSKQIDGGLETRLAGIGISYQMHGLVCLDKNQNVLRPSIIWCDSRAVSIGDLAFDQLGSEYCMTNLLNSPGNFTASKLAWVKENEPKIFEQIDKICLPGDYLAMKLSGTLNTTMTGLSEGVFFDFKEESLSEKLLEYYGLDRSLIPDTVDVFSVQSKVISSSAKELGISEGVPISYRAGDQPNNALSLGVLEPGQIAATGGTSGVVYGVSSLAKPDPESRVNTFLHVNHSTQDPRYGVLMCVNGCGIQNRWIKENFNQHDRRHLLRASQEGIVFAMMYGVDIMKDLGVETGLIRAGDANMFLSPLFCEAFTNLAGGNLEIMDTDGSLGAARGAGLGCGIYNSNKDAFLSLKPVRSYQANKDLRDQYLSAYESWKKDLEEMLNPKTSESVG